MNSLCTPELQQWLDAQQLPHNTLERLATALLISTRPVSLSRLQDLFAECASPIAESVLEACLERIRCYYASHLLQLHKTAEGFVFCVDVPCKETLHYWLQGKPERLTKATLETLAIIAFQQPITRPEIEAIRGVSVSQHTVQNLEEKGWIQATGHKDTPGNPTLYGTTPQFLTEFSIPDLEYLQAMGKDIAEKFTTPTSVHTSTHTATEGELT